MGLRYCNPHEKYEDFALSCIGEMCKAEEEEAPTLLVNVNEVKYLGNTAIAVRQDFHNDFLIQLILTRFVLRVIIEPMWFSITAMARWVPAFMGRNEENNGMTKK